MDTNAENTKSTIKRTETKSLKSLNLSEKVSTFDTYIDFQPRGMHSENINSSQGGINMFWQQRPHPNNWIEQIRYFTDFHNKLTEDELRDAFINLAHLYVTDFSNLRLLEDAIIKEFGKEGEDIIEEAITETPAGMDLAEIDMNDGDERDILGITLNMCDFIEERWF